MAGFTTVPTRVVVVALVTEMILTYLTAAQGRASTICVELNCGESGPEKIVEGLPGDGVRIPDFETRILGSSKELPSPLAIYHETSIAVHISNRRILVDPPTPIHGVPGPGSAGGG